MTTENPPSNDDGPSSQVSDVEMAPPDPPDICRNPKRTPLATLAQTVTTAVKNGSKLKEIYLVMGDGAKLYTSSY